MQPFIIYSLPRSRSSWLSAFLTYGDRKCGHDIIVDIPDLVKIKAFFSIPNVGTAETGMVDGWKLIKKHFPNIKTVLIRRPLDEVKGSLAKFGIFADEELERRDKLLDELQKEMDVITYDYSELNYMNACKEIFEYCLELPFDKKWWKELRNKNIQIDLIAQMKKIEEKREEIEKLKSDVSKLLEAA